VLIATLGVNVGLIYNLLFPMMKWENVNKPVKQSLSVLFTMLTAFILAALLVVFAIYSTLHILLTLGISVGVIAVLVVATYVFICQKGEKLLLERA